MNVKNLVMLIFVLSTAMASESNLGMLSDSPLAYGAQIQESKSSNETKTGEESKTSDLEEVSSNLRILSLDGGGVRGIAEIRFLMRLEEATGLSISDMFHIVGGTSAGGMIACLLTIPNAVGSRQPKYTAHQIFDIVLGQMHTIFTPRYLSLGGLFGPKYSTSSYHDLLRRYFGTRALRDTTIPTAVYAYHVEKNKIISMSSWGKEIFRTVDAVAATSAAQTLFNPLQADSFGVDPKNNKLFPQSKYTLTDGATGANNPTLKILSEALKLFPTAERFEILSLGSGVVRERIDYQDIDHAGVLTWVGYLARFFTQGQSSISHDFMQTLVNDSDIPNIRKGGIYSRWSPPLQPENKTIDNYRDENLRAIIEATDYYIELRQTDFDMLVSRLRQPKAFFLMGAGSHT